VSPLEIAISQIGVAEATGKNDGIPADRYNSGEEKPWCAAFVAWCFEQAKTPLPGKPWLLASVQYMEDQFKKVGKWTERAKAQPQPGDIVFFGNRGKSDKGPGRHVGIVEKVDQYHVHTIEGNLSNSVRRASHSRDDRRISGYGRW
jgi:uncharacterized protein (TIGR02594 family)